MEKKAENQFLVSLEGLKLSNEQKIKINSGIQDVVMRELAQMDNLDNFAIVKKKKSIDVNALHPFIWGIIWDNGKKVMDVNILTNG